MQDAWSELILTLWRNPDVRAVAVIVALSFVFALPASRAYRRWDRRRTGRPKHIYRTQVTQFDPSDLRNPLAQIEAISRCGFERWPLLNREEARLLPFLEGLMREAGKGHRLMAQTSLGELIRPVQGPEEFRRRGYAAINSKRLDFAIIDRFGYLVVAVEYQGSGHYHTQSFMRDAVKREALRKAGVETVEIPKRFDQHEVRARLLALMCAEPGPAAVGA